LPDLPRISLLDGPTPLQPMPRLANALGGRVDLWIKREDLGPLAFSGNKVRNLEFLLGGAIAGQADTIVTSGRRWSNHCRLTAAACARTGLQAHLVLSGPATDAAANVGLIELFGGTVHAIASEDRAEREALVARVAADLRVAGRRVSIVPVGGSGAAGAWGQVLAALEALDQAAARGFVPDVIVLPSASGGTQAGLVVGRAIAAVATRIVGVLVARTEPELRPIIERLVREVAAMARIDAPLDGIDLDPGQHAPGYGKRNAAADEASRLIARTEGILVDPVYTAKGLAGFIGLVRSGEIDGRRALFWHGGGLPAIFDVRGA
jgi:1-aminocyclopropane-1-carboxylate deaminase/D-cysteine desulfhydrase-like pyridoxal-dependent ACC family enzyme